MGRDSFHRNDHFLLKYMTEMKEELGYVVIRYVILTNIFFQMRLLTCFVYTCFEQLPQFKLSHSTDPDVTPEDWKVFSICYNVESTQPQVDSYRYQLQNLEKLTYGKPQAVMCQQTDFKTIPLRYLCGTLFINFRLLWEPVTRIIASYGNEMDAVTFWNVFGEELKQLNGNVRFPKNNEICSWESNCSFVIELFEENQQFDSRPDFVNYRVLLWQALTLFPNVAEAKTRDVAEAFLDFIE